jgi:hypothetical protein
LDTMNETPMPPKMLAKPMAPAASSLIPNGCSICAIRVPKVQKLPMVSAKLRRSRLRPKEWLNRRPIVLHESAAKRPGENGSRQEGAVDCCGSSWCSGRESEPPPSFWSASLPACSQPSLLLFTRLSASLRPLTMCFACMAFAAALGGTFGPAGTMTLPMKRSTRQTAA